MAKILSIIVPIYQVEKYLDRCLTSIFKQTYTDFEVILVDDGSLDESHDIAYKWSLKDKRFKLYSKENGGLSSARNFGLQYAHGYYIAFVDSDDFVDPDMYALLISKAEKYNSDITICSYYKFYENNKLINFSNPISNINDKILTREEAINLLCSNEIESHVWDRIYKKDLFCGLKFKVGVNYEDIYLMHHLFLKSNKIVFIDSPKYYYVQRTNSICQTPSYKNCYDYVNGFITRFNDISFLLTLDSKNKLFQVILNTYFYVCQYKGIEKRLKDIYKTIKKIGLENNLFNSINKKTKIKILLKKIGIGIRFQYNFFNLLKNFKFLHYFVDKSKISPVKEVKKQNFVYMGEPEYGNIGDQAIYYQSIKYIKENFNNDIFSITENQIKYKFNSVKKIIGKKTILFLQGGGNIGDVYPDQELIRDKIFKKYKNNKIIIMPSTIYFQDEKHCMKILKKYKSKNILLICREKFSYEFLKKYEFKNIRLAADIVTYPKPINEYRVRNKCGIALREDEESVLSFEQKEKIKELVVSNGDNFLAFDTILNENINSQNRENIFNSILSNFSKFKYVITDRLHAMVFCYLTNTPCFVLNNYNKKIIGVYDWIKNSKIHLINDLNDFKIDTSIFNLDSSNFNSYDFNNLTNAIKMFIEEENK